MFLKKLVILNIKLCEIHQANYALNSLLKINLDKITANEFEFYYGNR